MANTLSADINFRMNAKLVDGIGSWPIPTFTEILALTSGISAEQFDMVYANERTIASSGSPDTLDLNGVLKMANGTNADFIKLCLIMIQNKSSAQKLIVGGGSNCLSTLFNDVSDKLVILPNGFAIIGAPEASAYVVTPSTADILQVACDGGTNILYDIWILGRSA